MTSTSGGEAIVNGLVAHGVDTVFGLPGAQIYGLFDAFHQAQLKVIGARHEQACGYMAFGYARASGRPGVFSVVPGPGVLNASVWDKLVAAGKVDTAKVRVISTTPPYYDYNWTVRGNLDPALVEKIKAAFLALDPANPEHKAILDLQAASRFIETKPENYAGIEEAARAAGLLK